MSTPKHSLDERVIEKQKQLEEMLKKVKQQEAQLKQLEAKKKEQDRKNRAHRLIEIGGAVESILGCPIGKEDIPKLIFFLQDLEEEGYRFSRAMGVEPKDVVTDETDFSMNGAVEL